MRSPSADSRRLSWVLALLVVGCSTHTATVRQPPPERVRQTDAAAQPRPGVTPSTRGLVGSAAASAAAGPLLASIVEPSSYSAPRTKPEAHHLAHLSQEEIAQLLKEKPEAVGSISVGRPNSGRLMNGVRLPEDDRWVVVDPAHAYGTEETIDFLRAAVASVNRQYPNTPRLHIGHVSSQKGGWLSPHRSHQSGRDADVGFYYVDGEQWYRRGTKDNLDLERTWALIKAFVIETDVRFILLDHRIQVLLRAHAEGKGEDPAWLKDLFDGTKGKRRALIRHVAGHATHMHVRFYNPVAQETARLSYPALVQLGLIEPPTHYVEHKVRKGETLIHLAKRYGTTVKAIKRANRLRSNTIIARKSYKIPRKGPAAIGGPVEIPPRRYPPEARSGQPEQGG